jgi:hypothetical protein
MDSHPIHFHGHHGAITGTDGGPIRPSAQWPVTTLNVPVGMTMDLEFIADNPGDWPLHCHKNHHAMNAMGHSVPNTLGADLDPVESRIQKLLPGYMSMGRAGMIEMAAMRMPAPPNTVPMMAGEGPFGPIGMGGMFTVIKIRDGITSYADPGWYAHPPGTVAHRVSGPASSTTKSSAVPALYTCPMHPEVAMDKPGTCPKCGMKLVIRK